VSPQGELHHRLNDALGAHDPDPEVYSAILTGYMAAGGDDATWDDLDPGTQALIVSCENGLPRTSWEDPEQVPDNVPDDF
jgi:hypothetical protein